MKPTKTITPINHGAKRNPDISPLPTDIADASSSSSTGSSGSGSGTGFGSTMIVPIIPRSS